MDIDVKNQLVLIEPSLLKEKKTVWDSWEFNLT